MEGVEYYRSEALVEKLTKENAELRAENERLKSEVAADAKSEN